MKSFTVYEEYFDLITLLPDIEEQKDILFQITKYMLYDKKPELNDNQMKIFKNLKRPLDKSKTKSKATSKTNQNKNTSNDVNVNVYVNVYEYIENNIGITISGTNYEKISNWLKVFNEEIIKYAVDICVANNKKSLSYIFGILKNWKSKNYKTLEEVKAEHKENIIPEWFDKKVESVVEENQELKELIKQYE